MNSKQALYKLLHLALIEIGLEAEDDGNVGNIVVLSGLFRDLPLALSQNHVDYDSVLYELTERASYSKELSDWLNIVTVELTNNY